MYPLPPNENDRLAAVNAIRRIRESRPRAFEYVAKLASEHFRVPIALVSVVDRAEQWFVAAIGFDQASTPRDQAFCSHAIMADEVMVVEDTTRDPRFRANPLVAKTPHIRFYAGAPLVTRDGFRIGTVCVLDLVPRSFTTGQRIVLRNLAKVALEEMERLPEAPPVATPHWDANIRLP